MGLQERLKTTQTHVEHLLKKYLPPIESPLRLHQAMHYCVLGGGKRLRAFLATTTAECFGEKSEHVLPIACALECMHAYSLVHDDLPAMDNDALRRGKPTCHIAFDEATAILVGDALQTLAFEILSQPELPFQKDTQLKMIQILAAAAGAHGMVKGQAFDMAYEGRHVELAQLEAMHVAKTGALIEASVLLGALTVAEISDTTLHALKQFARHIGLAFQIKDDILDLTASTDILGKPARSDEHKHKSTYPALLGLSGAEEKLNMHFAEACSLLETIKTPTDKLKEVAQLIIERVA